MKNTSIIAEFNQMLYELECDDGWISDDYDKEQAKEHRRRKKALRAAIEKLSKKDNPDTIKYKADGIKIEMPINIAKEFIERLIDEHLYSDPIEKWIYKWGTEFRLFEDMEEN